MFDLLSIGKKIKKLRKEKKISQEKLAEMISMNHRSILRIENSQTVPTLETLCKIAETLEVDIVDFFEQQKILNRDDIIKQINNKLDELTDEELMVFYKKFKMLL